MKRNNFSQLPNSSDLQNILASESKRALPEGKEDLHYFDFSTLVDLGNYFGVDTKILTSEYTKEDIEDKNFLNRGKDFTQSLKDKILEKELSKEDIKVLNNVYDYLAEEDPIENVDLIFVFGAKTPLRIEKAIEIYKQKISKTIVVSGKGPHYTDNSKLTEASVYAKIAMDAGVPGNSILKEEHSITIPDNVRSSLNLLDSKGISYNSIILINSPYTQRRGWAHFKKYTSDNVKFIRINSNTADQYKRGSWYKNSSGIDVITSEFFKAKVAVSLNTV